MELIMTGWVLSFLREREGFDRVSKGETSRAEVGFEPTISRL
jgi:hypothetical protein